MTGIHQIKTTTTTTVGDATDTINHITSTHQQTNLAQHSSHKFQQLQCSQISQAKDTTIHHNTLTKAPTLQEAMDEDAGAGKNAPHFFIALGG